MGSVRKSDGRRYPLHITLTFAFTAILLAFGCVLIGFNYLESRKIALDAADRQMQRVESHLAAGIRSLYGPVQNAINVSARIVTADMATMIEDLGLFTEALRIKPDLSALFVGHDDGSFFLVRTAENARNAGAADHLPPNARFVAQRIRRDVDPPVEEVLLFDDDLRPIEVRPVAWTGFDPRARDWYRAADGTSEQIITEFYRFFTTREIGVTIARRLRAGGGVVGADLSLDALSSGLAVQRMTPGARLAMLEPSGRVIALSESLPSWEYPPDGDPEHIAMPMLSELDDEVFDALARRLSDATVPGSMHLEVEGVTWLVSLSRLPVKDGEPIILANLVPRDELLTGVARIRDQSALISGGILLLALLLAMGVARHVSGSLRALAGEAHKIRELRFDAPVTTRSNIEEVDELATTMGVMKASLQRFLEISRALSAEKRFDVLLDMILDEVCRVSGADGGAVLLRSDDDRSLELALTRGPSHTPAGSSVSPDAVDELVLAGEVVRIDDVRATNAPDCAAIHARFQADEFRVGSVLCVPLRTQQDETIGELQLVFRAGDDGDTSRVGDHTLPYIEALSSSAAVALDNRRLIRAQRDLLDSFIHVVAGAIDAKSPYTHGHCQRVPEVARMLAEAAHEADDGPLAGFHLTDDEWYELHLASWLHDCGKVTTPEYVVDKASKLETIHNRIHEIRTRCEVLWRDAEIEYYRAMVEGQRGERTLREELQARLQSIREEFEFIAQCNLGDRPLSDEDVERLRRIASRTWTRNLDDRLGLSHLELQRRGDAVAPELPVREPLLADRPEHVVPRPDGPDPFADEPHGFLMDVPENLYDHGELYNLSTRRGTLTAEERFKINEHVIQSIRMLGRLPFPREMRRVPDWAGNHHEKLDGTGYPRRLGRADLSVPERIMAIADIFEALTSSDRPYMEPRPLDQAVRIMHSMCERGHLCPDLFALFLESEVHLRYAREHMRAEQLDAAESA